MKRRNSKNSKNISVTKFAILLFIVAITFIVSAFVINIGLQKYIENTAFIELKSTAEEQASVISKEIDRQFNSLLFLRDNELVSGNLDLSDLSQDRSTFDVLRDYDRWCALGYADKDGNGFGYDGEYIGNISDRAYFRDVISGEKEKTVEYLKTTYKVQEPRVLFSIPTYDGDEISGVMFASKEVNVLESSILSDRDTIGKMDIFITDIEGNIIATNAETQKQKSTNNYFESYVKDNEKENEIKSVMQTLGEGQSSFNNEEYTIYTPLELNDWYLFCIVNKEDIRTLYSENMEIIEGMLMAISAVFGALIVLVLGLALLVRRNYKRNNAALNAERMRTEKILTEIGCETFEYDVKNNSLGAPKLLEKYGLEFYSSRIEGNIEKVKETKTSISLEFPVINEGKTEWFKMVLVPVFSQDKEITHIVGSIICDTDAHDTFEKAAEMLNRFPGGTHRCYLSNPIHVEYASDGLAKMLGYTKEELKNVMVDDKYTLAVYEPDRSIFKEFVSKLCSKPMTLTCEYRMVCKDGSVIPVSDTMESVLASSGIMYGYSTVVDITDFKEQEAKKERELRKSKEIIEEGITREQELEDKLRFYKAKAFESQMHPHFLYNALASIREIVLEDPQWASELIYDFTTHLRACVKSMSSKNTIPFMQEVENIKAYVNIEKMRFGDKLEIDYEIDDSDFTIVPLSIQPLVENAIRHGIYQRGKLGGRVVVKAFRTPECHVVCVEDNGIGFDYEKVKAEVERGERDSTGMENIIFRLQKILGAKVEIDSIIDVGTKVTVTIPIATDNDKDK